MKTGHVNTNRFHTGMKSHTPPVNLIPAEFIGFHVNSPFALEYRDDTSSPTPGKKRWDFLA